MTQENNTPTTILPFDKKDAQEKAKGSKGTVQPTYSELVNESEKTKTEYNNTTSSVDYLTKEYGAESTITKKAVSDAESTYDAMIAADKAVAERQSKSAGVGTGPIRETK